MPERPPEPRVGAASDADVPRVVDLAKQTRADVRMLPETVDTEHRSVEVVWSTGAAVRSTRLPTAAGWPRRRKRPVPCCTPARRQRR